VKSEASSSYSWKPRLKCQGREDHFGDGGEIIKARNFMKANEIGDSRFFYHSGKEKAIGGLAEVREEGFSRS